MSTETRRAVIDDRPSMLLAFRGQNIRSFRDEFALELHSTAMAEPGVVRHVPWHAGGKPVGVLPAAAIFGANGSGKSNVLKALYDMRSHVLFSLRHNAPGGGFPRRAYLLSEDTASPSRFEVDLIVEGVRHEYGFVVDDERVLEEWAIHYPKGRAALLFERARDEARFGSSIRSQARATAELLRPEVLFLSADNAVRQPTLSRLSGWFARNLLLAEAGSRSLRQALTTKMLEEPTTRTAVLGLLQAADLGISGASRVEIAGPILRSLERGSVLLADELDSGLHPDLVAALVSLYQDPSVNRRRAQLICTSHDATLLGDSARDRPLGRDQVWFTEKYTDGASRLYPLSDFAPRKEEPIGKRYLAGRYGGKPIISRTQFADAVAGVVSDGPR